MHMNNYSEFVKLSEFGVKISNFVLIRSSNSGRKIPFDPDYVNIQLLMHDNFSMKFRECYLLSVSYNMHIYL